MNSLCLKLLLAQLSLQVINLLPRSVKLGVFLANLAFELSNLVIKELLVSFFAILEVFDNVEFMLLQDIVVRVHLFVLLLQAYSFSLCLYAQTIVYLKLLAHMLMFLLFIYPYLLDFL